MSRPIQEIFIVLVTLIGALIAQTIFHAGAVSYTPAPILLAIIITWSIPQAWRYLLALAIFSELFTTLPLGILSLAITIPLLIFYIRGRVEADISFSFLLLILVTVLLQFSVLTSYDTIHTLLTESGQGIITVIPWRLLFSSWLITSALAFAACVIITNQMPPQERHNLIAFNGRPRHG